MRGVKTLMEFTAFLTIAAIPCVMGGVLGLLAYQGNPSGLTLMVAGACGLTGLTYGTIKAIKIYKNEGTLRYLSAKLGFNDTHDGSERRGKKTNTRND